VNTGWVYVVCTWGYNLKKDDKSKKVKRPAAKRKSKDEKENQSPRGSAEKPPKAKKTSTKFILILNRNKP